MEAIINEKLQSEVDEFECPFCEARGSGTIYAYGNPNGATATWRCNNCGASGPDESDPYCAFTAIYNVAMAVPARQNIKEKPDTSTNKQIAQALQVIVAELEIYAGDESTTFVNIASGVLLRWARQLRNL